jgi:NTP pyrophosphatase (non-canonical NTP hydrolase)
MDFTREITAAVRHPEAGLTIREVQRAAWANKLAKGFNVTDVPMEFGLLVEEIGEAFSAWRKGRPHGPELADVAIFLAGLAEMTGVDLEAAVAEKLAVNETREYVTMPNGTPVKAAGPDGYENTRCTS